MKKFDYLVINTKVLPEVFNKVAMVKSLLSDGTYSNISQAVKKVGLSRSAFYKYKDYVFENTPTENKDIFYINAALQDKAGVFSALTAKLYENGFNILSINQSLPVNGTASVSLSVRRENQNITLNELFSIINGLTGIVSVKVN